MVRSSAQYGYDSLEVEESHGYEETRDCKRAEWPSIDSVAFMKPYIVGAVNVVLVLGALNMIAVISILITLLVKFNNTANSSDFALYKNTKFKQCASVVPEASNCSAIAAAWKESDLYSTYADLGRYYVLETGVTAPNKYSYDWCQIVSCFNGYKVIPSSATDSAMGPTALYGWWAITLTSVSAVWSLRKVAPYFNQEVEECRGIRDISVIDWAFLIWDIVGPMVTWWISFAFSFIYPTPKATYSLLAWTVTWRYSSQIQFHPYSCILSRVPRIRRLLPWIVGLVAVLQWGATIYSVHRQVSGGTRGMQTIYNSYTCLGKQIPSAPGTSTCSAAELCQKSWLFSEPHFYMPGDDAAGFPAGRAYEKWSPILILAVVGGGTIAVFGLLYPISLGTNWNQRHADSWVAFDTECRAVHVALSPWRFYLDVDKYARALRIARLWFGV
ncbi:hypothetical protein Asppvi_008353 [Aspergillus pseudoviridinutans]|uniref:Uncharacterized protein n=1 Tax=Aspergillus pseudoviridinutans TaxID=1517512 RepID=A0A9P3BI31_9EURO|nr:uncharacterized protein Asppvi_008353 [Aspergillus pseudoviridinutans]GIJ89413.1 hypothetical protein Asppvi_008353 [Aspergillus pseudoviridinutans]